MRLILEGDPDQLARMLHLIGNGQGIAYDTTTLDPGIAEPPRKRASRRTGKPRGRPIGERPSARTLIKAIVRAGQRGATDDDMKSLLEHFGVQRLRDIKPDQRAEAVCMLNALHSG